MARALGRRCIDGLRRGLVGAILLAGCTALLWAALHWLIGFEEQAAEVEYALYLAVGRGTLYGIAAFVLLAALHRWLHGRDDIRPQGPGDGVRWWSPAERTLHWLLVLCFAVLLVTGIYLYDAGGGLPSPLTRSVRDWHFGEGFMGVGALLFLRWFRDAIPRRYDLRWLAAGGGYLRRRPGAAPLPAGRFNGGQKLWFWLQSLAGITMALTGYELQHGYSRFDEGYLTVLTVHLVSAALFLWVLTVHIYLAVIGMRGALRGMVRGWVGRSQAARLHPFAEALAAPRGARRSAAGNAAAGAATGSRRDGRA